MSSERSTSEPADPLSPRGFSAPQLTILDTLLRSSPDVVLVNDREGRFQYVGGAAASIGLPEHDILGKTAADLHFPQTVVNEFDSCRKNALTSGGPVTRELSFETTGGERIYSCTFSPVAADDAAPGGTLCIARDITERRVEERSQQHLAAIVTSADDAVVGKDLDGIIVSWNKAAERIFGYSTEEMIGKPKTILFPPDRLQEEAEILARVRRGEPTEHFETVRRRKDGSDVEVSLNISPIHDKDGRIVGAGTIIRDIAKLKHDQRLLSQQAELLELAHDTIFVHDLENRITFWNGGAEAMYGWSKDEALGQVAYKFLQTRFPVPFDSIKADLETAGRWEGELIHTRRDGSRIVVASRWALQRGTDGQPLATMEINRDITERKLAEERLRESEDRFRATFEQAAVGIAHVTPDGRWLRVNQRLCDILGHSRQELLTLTFQEITHPDDVENDLVQVEQLLNGAIHRYSVEKRYRHRGGNFLWANLTVSLVRGPAGEPEYFLSVIEDITARKQAEAVILESEERFRILIDSMADGLVTIDDRGIIQTMNPAAESLFGYTADEIAGRNVSMLMPDPYRSEHDTFIKNYLTTGIARIIGIGREVEGLRRDGTVFPLELTVVEMHLKEERIFVGTLRDLTERNRLEQQLRQAQKMESLGRLAGGVAHDYNNLLAIILGYAELIEEDLPEDSGAIQSLHNIQGAAASAATLTQQLLTFARRHSIEPRVFSVNTLLHGIVRLLKPILGADIELIMRLSEHECHIRADFNQMEQVLMNLIINARDAMSSGGKLLFQTESMQLADTYLSRQVGITPGPYCLVAVTDTGKGMSEEVRQRIFEPFYTTKEAGKGTGLGMAICYSIVKQAGGYIWVYSEIDIGTTVKIYLPCVDPAEMSHESRLQTEVRGGTETILVVEDEPLVRELTVNTLRMNGYTVLTAADGAEALEILASNAVSIQLVVTDAIMPAMGGRELIGHLRERYGWIRVLLASGYSEEGFAVQSALPKDTAYLQKPFSSIRLLGKVRDVLDATGGAG